MMRTKKKMTKIELLKFPFQSLDLRSLRVIVDAPRFLVLAKALDFNF